MRVDITNTAVMTGTYEGDELVLTSTLAESTFIDGLDATKTANKEQWSGGTLEYTVTIDNTTDEDFENPVFTDTLHSFTTLVEGSVKVGGAAYAYTFVSPLLTINLPTITAGGSLVVTFEVKRA